MAQMLAMVVNELQNIWDEQLPHVEFAYNISVGAGTGLAPNEVLMGRLVRLHFTIFERTGVAGHQSLARDHLAYCDLATDRQQRAHDIVSETPCPDSFSCGTPQLNRLRCTAPGSQICR